MIDVHLRHNLFYFIGTIGRLIKENSCDFRLNIELRTKDIGEIVEEDERQNMSRRRSLVNTNIDVK